MTVWIKGGKFADIKKNRVLSRDIIVERGKITNILPAGKFKAAEGRVKVLDATGKTVVPGLIDMHVHLREPGHEYKETIETGARAGVAGGFTGVACMPNTVPANDSGTVTEFILKQAKKANLLHVYPVAAITKGQKGKTLTEFGDLRKSGAVGISDDGWPVTNSDVMRRALEYARVHDLTVISHCEDLTLSGGGVMHEGVVSTQIGLNGIPAASEEIMVQREIALAKLTGCPVHIAHVSTQGSVELIARAKEGGIPVTAETAPHYFTLDHEAVRGYDTHGKMNPPLRGPDDVAAIKKGLKDEVIDVIATDHAPHSPLEKELEFDKAAFGIIGLETALPLTMALVREGVLDLTQALKKLTLNPASILGVKGGALNKGGDADLTIMDPTYEYILQEEDIKSKSRNSPFIGKHLKGCSMLTMVRGRIVWKREP